MLRTYREQAIVLRTYRLGEADRIVLLLGKNNGMIRSVAKGVRRPSSRFGGRLEPFNVVDLQLYRGRNLDTITQADLLVGYSRPLGADYGAFTAAKIMVETVQKLTDSTAGADDGVFGLLHGALAALANERLPDDLVVGSFLLRLMRLAGWDPVLDECAHCGAKSPLRQFCVEAGGMVCPECNPGRSITVDEGTVRLLRALLTGDWETTGDASARQREVSRQLAGTWAQYHLEQRLRALPFFDVQEVIGGN